jgi:hypothetical protein
MDYIYALFKCHISLIPNTVIGIGIIDSTKTGQN